MKMVKVYLTPEVAQAVREYTEEIGIPVSVWMRKIVHAELNRRKRLCSASDGSVWVKLSKRL